MKITSLRRHYFASFAPLACLGTLVSGLWSAPAHAQDPPHKGVKLPLKANPLNRPKGFLNRDGLKMPKKYPSPQHAAAAEVTPTPSPDIDEPNPAGPANTSSSQGDDIPSFANLQKAGTKRCKPMPPNAKVTFDFKGELQELVEIVSKTTCKNFILTNKTRSQKFEIISPTPITVEEAWRAFLSSLEANDFTIYQVGRYYKIIQATEGTRAPVAIYDGDEPHPVTDTVITKIWRLRYVSDVNTVVNYLNIFKSGKGQIHGFPNSNVIICTDYGTSMTRLERILQEVDQPGALEKLRVLQVEFASATEIAEKLTQIFEPQKAGAPRTPTKIGPQGNVKARKSRGRKNMDDGSVNVSKILADERTNKLIVIASDEAIKQITSVMRELDVPQDTGGQIQVVRLRHADAEELASTLASLSQGRPTTQRTRAPASPPGTPKPPVAAASAAALFEGEVKVTADKATNSLVITASKSDFNSMQRVISRLDVPRYQVFVEAVIMEISVKRDRNLGVGWHGGLAPTIDGQRTPILFGSTPVKELSSLLATLSPASVAALPGLSSLARGPTLPGTESIVQGGVPSFGVILNALQTSNDVNVISTPHLLTVDNEEAEIQVNEKRPFPSGLSLGNLAGLASGLGSNASAAGNLAGLGLGSVSFNREDVGLTLKVKPQINDDEYVRLEIDQELSDVAGIDQATQQTITSKRAAKTVVVVRSQDSVVIGGLVRQRESIDEGKTPLFGDLPLLGWLFKRQQKITDKVNLVLVLTPTIIRNPHDFRKIFERKMEERREFANLFYGAVPDLDVQIDWDRKVGPLAAYRMAIRKELVRAENDGPGAADETVIRSDEDDESDQDDESTEDDRSPGDVVIEPESDSGDSPPGVPDEENR